MRRRRLAGSRWRVNVVGFDIDCDGKTVTGSAYEVTSDPDAAAAQDARRQSFARLGKPELYMGEPPIVLEATEFDELVIGADRDPWIHLEQMDTGKWWLDVGGLVIRVDVNRDGHATHVYAALETPRDKVKYSGDIA